MIVAGRGEYLVAAPQHVLPHYLRRHVRVACLCQVAICRSANETAFSLRIEPACGFSVRYYWSEWRALSLIAAWPALLLLLLLLSTTTAASSLSAASALIASATAVVPVIAIAVSLIPLPLSLSLSLAAPAPPAAAALG